MEKFMPFLMAGVTAVPGAKVNIARIIEVLVIASLTAMATSYTSGKVLEAKMTSFEQRLAHAEDLEKTNTAAIRTEFAGLRNFVESHIVRTSK